jgi:predicted nuclease with TOPRIM domain
MTTPNEHPDPSGPTEAPGMTLQTEEAKATVTEIKAENAALKEANQAAEARAEATTEQVKQMAQATEEVLEELQETKEGGEQA